MYYSVAFLDALPHLCLHVNLVNGGSDSREVLSALTGLMEDSDPAVRKCFSQSVRFLLIESERNSGPSFLSEVCHFNCTESHISEKSSNICAPYSDNSLKQLTIFFT